MKRFVIVIILAALAFIVQAQEKKTGHTIKLGNYELYSSIIYYKPEKGGGIYEVVSPKISVQEEYLLYDYIRDHKDQIEEKLGVVVTCTRPYLAMYDRKTYEQYWENEKQRVFREKEEITKKVESLNEIFE